MITFWTNNLDPIQQSVNPDKQNPEYGHFIFIRYMKSFINIVLAHRALRNGGIFFLALITDGQILVFYS